MLVTVRYIEGRQYEAVDSLHIPHPNKMKARTDDIINDRKKGKENLPFKLSTMLTSFFIQLLNFWQLKYIAN